MKPWWKGFLAAALATGFFSGYPIKDGLAREVAVHPIASLQIQNPADPADVRFLWRFELPVDLHVDRLTAASLRVPAVGYDDVPVILARAEAAWSVQTNWTNAVQAMPGLISATFQPASMQVAGNRVDEENGQLISTGYEFNVRAEVKEWLASGVNNGVWVSRVPGSADDLRLAVASIEAAAKPTLILIFDDAP